MNMVRRRDAGRVQLTQRDVNALGWIGEQWVVRLDHVQQMLTTFTDDGQGSISAEATRHVLRRWTAGGG